MDKFWTCAIGGELYLFGKNSNGIYGDLWFTYDMEYGWMAVEPSAHEVARMKVCNHIPVGL